MINSIRLIIRRWKKSLENTYNKSEPNIISGAWVNFIGSPIYYIINTQVTHLEYENIYYRAFNMAFSLPLLFLGIYKKKYKELITIYWYSWIILTVSGFFTFMTLMNDFSVAWIVAETVMIFIVVILLGEVRSTITILFISTAHGILLYFLITNSLPDSSQKFTEFLSLFPLALICGLLFHYNSKKGEIRIQKERQKDLEDKNKLLRTLSGSIAHEVRNPLNTISVINSQINDALRNLDNEIMEIVNNANSPKNDDK